ncbi:MAG: M36 family metallopeptidase [Methylotenera sp.]|nr:M36 family metallopeptidase [Oligoflexia bacterium]
MNGSFSSVARQSGRKKVFCWISLCCLLSACGSKDSSATKASSSISCAESLAQTGAGSTGSGYIFNIDPMVSSGNQSLAPNSTQLDSYRSRVNLERLGGRGVLEGSYVEVRNGLSCSEGFGASDSRNQFLYPHNDQRFQEVMGYYYGDDYRHKLDQASSLTPAQPVVIIANCSEQDNAYYSRQVDSSGQVIDYVCLGYSGYTTGAYYADDATVITHELQHATTVHSYSGLYDLNQLWFDEAGSMNEAISDFMALMYEAPSVPGSFDLKLFSRWALGTFMATSADRGARRCPAYDSTSGSDCGTYSGSATPVFSALNNRVSYSYPDGLGWPYPASFTSVKTAFTNYSSQEEIHNASSIVTGSLWEIYSALKSNHAGDHTTAYNLTVKLVTQALATLPMPISSLDRSPVTFIKFGQALISRASAMNYSPGDQSSISTVLTQRGLSGANQLSAGWASVGTGSSGTPGVRVLDSPSTLKSWLGYMGFASTAIVSQSGATATNGQLDPGEVVTVWFDVLNSNPYTAGGVLVDVVSPDTDVSFLDGNYNFGYISATHAQVRYSKVNGSNIVTALNDDPNITVTTKNTGAGNSYFKTNKKFDSSWYTTLWMKVSPTAAHNKTVNLHVTFTPSNGPAATVDFPVVIH